MDESRPDEVTRPGFYRAALWCVRLAHVCVLFWILNLWFLHSVATLLPWLVGLGLCVTALAFLHLAGGRFVRRGTAWYLDGEMGRHFNRDLFWLPRR